MSRPFASLTILLTSTLSMPALAEMNPAEGDFPCASGIVLTPDGEIQSLPFADCFPDQGMASFNVPFFFSYYAVDDFEASIRDTLQALGFSYKPEIFRRPPSAECAAVRDGVESNFFWTDWVVINEDLLSDFSLEVSAFDVSLDERHQYRIQIYGCFSAGTTVQYVQVPGDACLYRQAPVAEGPNASLTSFVDVEHRGSGGLWRAYQNQEFDSAPLLTSVDLRLSSAIESVEPNRIRAA